jgi:uncharacterized protein (TIGR03083 family)
VSELAADTVAAYAGLASGLASIDLAQWDTQSLCSGWRVREVIAHLTMPVRHHDRSFEVGSAFTRTSDEIAASDARLPIELLLAQLRSDELAAWRPAGGHIGALTHVVVHGLDVTVPLGLPSTVSMSGVRAVLDSLAGGVHGFFGVSIAGMRLEATDLDWSYGAGMVLRAPTNELVLALTARRATTELSP